MHFRRPRIVNQYPDYPVPSTVVQTQVLDLFLGDGSIGANYTIIPTPNYDNVALIEQNLGGNSKVYVGLDVRNMGAMVDITFVIEFQDPDLGLFWFPSHEPAKSAAGGVETPLRADAIGLQEFVIGAAGQYIVATRTENPHFKKFRIRFRGAAGGPGAATDVRVYWWPDGGISAVEDQ